MTNKKIFELHEELSKIKGLKGVYFNYAVARNMAKLQSETELLKKSTEPSQKFIEYDNKRIELAKKHAKKDEKGNPVLEYKNGMQEFVLEDKSAFMVDLDKLKLEYKEALDARDQQSKDFDELLKKESDLELYKVKFEYIPVEITTEQMEAVLPIIEE